MSDPFYRSFGREAAGALVIGAVVTLLLVAGLMIFSKPDTVLMAENTASVTEPVTEDTPGPVIQERAILNDAGTPKPTLSDRER